MKQIVQDREDIAFYIKLLPLKIHPAAYKKSKAIVCERSLRLLEKAFDGRAVPDPTCETTEVDDTIEMAERMGITGTPTIVLPDGGIISGFRDSIELQQAIESAGLAAEEKEQEALREQEETIESQTGENGASQEGEMLEHHFREDPEGSGAEADDDSERGNPDFKEDVEREAISPN